MEMDAEEAMLLLKSIYIDRNDSDKELSRFLRSSKGKGIQPVLEIGNVHKR